MRQGWSLQIARTGLVMPLPHHKLAGKTIKTSGTRDIGTCSKQVIWIGLVSGWVILGSTRFSLGLVLDRVVFILDRCGVS